jgi:putative FmdB family regulatory protein
MPIYEYRCNDCNIQFDLRQKFSDPPADQCPQCGGNVRKLVSVVSFSLKGAGWFGDGYGTKAESVASEGEQAAGTGATSEIVSTDAAPAATTALPTIQAAAPTQIETKSTVAETPAPMKEKAEITSQRDHTAKGH